MSVEKIMHQLVVSVQSDEDHPLYGPDYILALSRLVISGGAKGLRLANPENIRNVKQMMPSIPVIGITKPRVKLDNPMEKVYITPTLESVFLVADSGADIVALDATLRSRPDGKNLSEIVQVFKQRYPKHYLMADVATVEEGVHAFEVGFDLIGTTLSGYTTQTLSRDDGYPDYDLLKQLIKQQPRPVILEGRVWSPEQVTKALDLGAYSVVVGSAITRPQLITAKFAAAVQGVQKQVLG